MRLDFKLPQHKSARVWIDELPSATFAGEQIIHRVPALQIDRSKDVRRVAIEALIPQGARAIYGLLGAEFVPRTGSTEMQVVSNTSSPKGELWKESLLADRFDEVRVGLPTEYVNGVIDGVDSAAVELRGVPPGQLHFQCASHGVVSSCVAGFKTLAQNVTRLLLIDDTPRLEEEIRPFLELNA